MPLFPYQREGMLHLAFNERALLADEMGLGKTIQAIAACALLHRLGQARRVLIVTPASLKTEWEEQIRRFTPLPYQIVFGGPKARLSAYGHAPFFTIVNYEQMVKDALTVNAELKPDIVVLDEAQRIKNWSTQTAQAIKRLQSRYAFVLTGTPIENRIDEIHSLMDFLDPTVLGPLFRFNREFYRLDDRGRPSGYQNLASLNARIKPYMLRRRKADVETELPDRTDKTFFVPLSDGQKKAYTDHEAAGHAARRAGPPPPAHPERAGQAAARAGDDAHDLRYQLHPGPGRSGLPQARRARKDPGRMPGQRGRQGDHLLGVGAHAPARARPVPETRAGLRLAHGQRPAVAPPRRDQPLQDRSGMPPVPHHRRRQHRLESPERQRRHQLRSALEPGTARTAHRARLAQAPDAARDRHPSGLRRHHRASHARDARQQAGARRGCAGPQGRPRRDRLRRWQTGLPGTLAPARRHPWAGGPAARRTRADGPGPDVRPACPGTAGRRPSSAARKSTRSKANTPWSWSWSSAMPNAGARSSKRYIGKSRGPERRSARAPPPGGHGPAHGRDPGAPRPGRPPPAHHARQPSLARRRSGVGNAERHCRRPSEQRPVPTAGRPSGA